jgi:hypothetical protein
MPITLTGTAQKMRLDRSGTQDGRDGSGKRGCASERIPVASSGAPLSEPVTGVEHPHYPLI